jgi:ssDNA-binding replication factor A large subunit
VSEELQLSGQYTPIGRLEEVAEREVDIQGTVVELWEPSTASIAQVGLLEDETGRVKVTVWKKSGQPWMEAGERVQIRQAAKSWYQGRVSVALTGWTQVSFPERDRWWE